MFISDRRKTPIKRFEGKTKRSHGSITESEAGEVSILVHPVYDHSWGDYTVLSIATNHPQTEELKTITA